MRYSVLSLKDAKRYADRVPSMTSEIYLVIQQLSSSIGTDQNYLKSFSYKSSSGLNDKKNYERIKLIIRTIYQKFLHVFLRKASLDTYPISTLL